MKWSPVKQRLSTREGGLAGFRVCLGLTLVLTSLFVFPLEAQTLTWVEGNRTFSQSELQDYLLSRQLDLRLVGHSPDDLRRARRLLEQFYRDRGFPLARVELKQVSRLPFEVVEGPRAEIGEIRFSGNQRFTAATLRNLFTTTGRLDFDELEEDLDELREFYRNWGFAKVQVGNPRLEVVERSRPDHFPWPGRQKVLREVDVTIPVQEGAEFSYERVDVPANFPDDIELPRTGELYRSSRIEELRNQITQHYFDQGQLLDGFQILEDVREASASVDLLVIYRILPPLTVRRIEFQGNLRYPDSFYRRELALEEEDFLDPRKIQQSLEALARIGVLESISETDVEIRIDRQLLTADLTLQLHEKDRHSIFFSFGPDGLGGVDGSLFYSVANLLGLGETLGLDLRVGSHTSEIAASVASRYLLGTSFPASLALRVFRRRTTFELPGVENLIRDLFTSDAEGIGLGTNYRIRENQTLGVDASWERLRSPFQAQHLTLTPAWQRLSPSGNGIYQGLRLSNRFSFLDTESNVIADRLDFSYQRSFDRSDLEQEGMGFRIHLAHGRFFGGPEPFFERVLKDNDELRGFSFTSGPWGVSGQDLIPLGGDSLMTFSSEYQVPLPRRFSLVPFFDSGTNFLTSTTEPTRQVLRETNRRWRASTGFEIRLRPFKSLPVTRLIFSWNPLRLDESFSINGRSIRLRDPRFSFRVAFF